MDGIENRSGAGNSVNTQRGGHELCAILLNPSLKATGSTSQGNLEIAAPALGYSAVSIVNLIDLPTRNSKELSPLAVDPQIWIAARPRIESALSMADGVIFAWGASRLEGKANLWKENQVEWIIEQTLQLGHSTVFMMDGSPRHPSRWRQYVGPQKQRVLGATLEERFQSALRRCSPEVASKNQEKWLSVQTATIQNARENAVSSGGKDGSRSDAGTD